MKAPAHLLVFAGLLLAIGGSIYGFLGAAPAPAQAAKTTPAEVQLLYGPAYLEETLGAIRSAKSRVWVAMYVMSYSEESFRGAENALLRALDDRHRHGVDVRVILDASLEWNENTGRMDGSENDKNKKAYDFLKERGIPVRYDALEQITHCKILVADDTVCVVGSSNWTYSALKKNVEVSVLLRSAGHNAELARLFGELWAACGKNKAWKP